jgi:predicted small lipoprotein YifL
MKLRVVLLLALMPVISACGTKSQLVTPQCSKEEKAENAETAANAEDAGNAPSAPSAPSTPAKPAPRCGKQVKGQRDPSQPPNPIAR